MPSLLDIGCGNGRFATYFAQRWGPDFRYVGVDASAALLQLARTRLGPQRGELLAADLTARPSLPPELGRRSFDLIVVFGVLHHLPGLATRRRLLSEAAELLAPGGLLVLAFWRFGRFERFRRRIVPWAEYNRAAERAVDPSDLETGDHLLAWGDSGDSYRYCHHADDSEAHGLARSLGLTPVDSFLADGAGGDLNLYHLLARPP